MALSQKERREACQAIFRSWKVGMGCCKCGYSEHHFALHMDHIVPIRSRIRYTIQSKAQLDRVMNDPNLQILCARCHNYKTNSNNENRVRKREKFESMTAGQKTSYLTSIRKQSKNRTILYAMKMARGCAKCGWAEHYTGLDFDHKEPLREKRRKYPTTVQKCYDFINDPNIQVLCSNCHYIKSWENKDYLKKGEE